MISRSILLLLFALGAMALLSTGQAAALSTPTTGQFAYFYKPPADGTSPANVAALNKYVILTHNDESYRSSLRQAGYTGYCDAEIDASKEPIRLMKYYRATFLALQNVI